MENKAVYSNVNNSASTDRTRPNKRVTIVGLAVSTIRSFFTISGFTMFCLLVAAHYGYDFGALAEQGDEETVRRVFTNFTILTEQLFMLSMYLSFALTAACFVYSHISFSGAKSKVKSYPAQL